MDHETVLSFAYENPEKAHHVEGSLRPEVGAIDGERSRASLTRDEETVRIQVAGADLVALRAGINTWSRLVDVAERSCSDVTKRSECSG